MKTNQKTIAAVLIFSLLLPLELAIFAGEFISKTRTAQAFEDNTAPELTLLTITPKEFNTSEQDQLVTVTVEINDSGLGFCPYGSHSDCISGNSNKSAGFLYISPLIGTSTQYVSVGFSGMWTAGNFQRISGDDKNGVYSASVTIPYGSKVGLWQVSTQIQDKIGNNGWYAYGSSVTNSRDISTIPNADFQIANTAVSNSVKIDANWTLSTSKASIKFPQETIVTRGDGGSYQFYKMINQNVAVEDLSTYTTVNILDELGNIVSTETVVDKLLGAIKLGIPGLNLSFSKPVEVSWNIGSQYNGYTLNINSLAAGESNWARETTCVVASGLCSFTVDHATYFSLSTKTTSSSSNSNKKIKLSVSVPSKTKKSSVKVSGTTIKNASINLTVNNIFVKTITANKKGKFSTTVTVVDGKNTIKLDASSSAGSKSVTKSVTKK